MTKRNHEQERGHRRRMFLAALYLCAGVLFSFSWGAMAQQEGDAPALPQPPSPPPQALPPPQDHAAPAPDTRQQPPLPGEGTQLPQADPLDFATPAQECDAVEDDWFSDAVFVGDSRSDGLRLYSGIRGADFLAYKSLMVFDVAGADGLPEKAIPKNGIGDKLTTMQWLEQRQYGKVYVMLGVNELGYGDDAAFEAAFRQLIDQVRQRQPDAVIYIQSLIPVEEAMAYQFNPSPWLNNGRVAEYNTIVQRVCRECKAVFVNVQEAMADETGALPKEGTTDGIHFTRSWYQRWYEYLKTHTVDPEAYAAGQV